ncbi:MAG: hypothetical protein IJT97_04490 [Bacteroidaceae bacterium]|nr:hypothetical protein [Bacteroidaceae bacterium]
MKKTNILALTAILTSTLLLANCKEDKHSSTIPAFDKVVTDNSMYQKNAEINYTVTFKSVGENIGGTYKFNVMGDNGKTLLSGETKRYSPVNSFTEMFKAPDSIGTFTLTVSAKTMAAYAGDKPYLDPAPMGNVQCKFTVTE